MTTQPSPSAAAPTPFARVLARSITRAGWLIGEALAGRPLRFCTSPSCQWAHIEHYYAPDCRA